MIKIRVSVQYHKVQMLFFVVAAKMEKAAFHPGAEQISQTYVCDFGSDLLVFGLFSCCQDMSVMLY